MTNSNLYNSQHINQHIDLYNLYHLGDSVFIFILFYQIKNYIEENNIIINYYCKEELHKQLSEFICSNNIKLKNYTENNIGLNVWINYNEYPITWSNWLNKNNYNNAFNEFYVIFFNQLLKKININQKINYLSYNDKDLLIRYNNFNEKFKNIDFLIINSVPMSGQYNYNETEWNNLCIKLDKKYKIITTKKVNDIQCTLDDNLTIKDIAALSTNIKNIIAVNTGVLPGLFNEYTLNNIDVLYYFDNNLTFSYPKFKKINNLNELNFLTIHTETFSNTEKNNLIYLFLLLLLLFLFR